MTEFPFLTGPTLLIAAIVAIPLSFLVSVVLFRAACDLCYVEPPGFLKACLVVILVGLVCAPVAAGVVFGFGVLGGWLKQPAVTMQVLAAFAAVPPCAAVAGAVYIPLLRTRFLKGATIYVVQWLLGALVWSVLVLFGLGAVTLVQGMIRLA
jgi:hypothetical protein